MRSRMRSPPISYLRLRSKYTSGIVPVCILLLDLSKLSMRPESINVNYRLAHALSVGD